MKLAELLAECGIQLEFTLDRRIFIVHDFLGEGDIVRPEGDCNRRPDETN